MLIVLILHRTTNESYFTKQTYIYNGSTPLFINDTI